MDSNSWWAIVKHIKDMAGYNRLFGFKWGAFDIVWDEEHGWYIFTYKNGKVVDKIWFVNSGKLKGFFYLRGKLIGEFTMEKIS